MPDSQTASVAIIPGPPELVTIATRLPFGIGQLENAFALAKRFFKELKIGQKTAKIRKYKNRYKNIIVQEVPNGVKISAERQPIKETYWLKMYQIVTPTSDGPKITEEMMQTKVQTFLKMQDKGEE